MSKQPLVNTSGLASEERRVAKSQGATIFVSNAGKVMSLKE